MSVFNFMSCQDASLLDEFLDTDDVSLAWLVWSGAAEAALADAFRFSGGSLPSRGLVLGRSSALLRVVRLGGHQVRKARANVADALDTADVFLYRDSSVATLLDMRRRFKAVVDVLGAMIRSGFLFRGRWSLLFNRIGLLLWGLSILLLWMIFLLIGVWTLVHSFMPLLVFIADLVISSITCSLSSVQTS